MTTSKSLFDLAQLTEASYADLRNSNLGVTLLTDTSGDPLFSQTQATEFSANWKVILCTTVCLIQCVRGKRVSSDTINYSI